MSDLFDLGKRVASSQDEVLAHHDDELEKLRANVFGTAARAAEGVETRSRAGRRESRPSRGAKDSINNVFGRAARTVSRPARISRRRRVVMGALAALALSALALVAVRINQPTREATPTSLQYRVGASSTHAELGEWLVALDAPLPIRFSDGSTVTLQTGADAVVESLSSDGARFVLATGSASVFVESSETTLWFIDAGPFEVRVTGTEFDVRWDPQGAEFEITMHTGRVQVSGPLMDVESLDAGQQLRVELRAGSVERTTRRGPTETLAPVQSGVVATVEAEVPHRPAAHAHRPVAQAVVPAAPEQPALQALLREGRYQDAVTLAETGGWDATLAALEADDLVDLGDAARFVGRQQSARRAYLACTIRRTCPSRAAFELGRLAAARSDANAADWFRTYLQRSPRGPLAREATGRLLESLHANGDETGPVANRYLRVWPQGPHADLARALSE